MFMFPLKNLARKGVMKLVFTSRRPHTLLQDWGNNFDDICKPQQTPLIAYSDNDLHILSFQIYMGFVTYVWFHRGG